MTNTENTRTVAVADLRVGDVVITVKPFQGVDVTKAATITAVEGTYTLAGTTYRRFRADMVSNVGEPVTDWSFMLPADGTAEVRDA